LRVLNRVGVLGEVREGSRQGECSIFAVNSGEKLVETLFSSAKGVEEGPVGILHGRVTGGLMTPKNRRF